jgi:hypothetical protein
MLRQYGSRLHSGAIQALGGRQQASQRSASRFQNPWKRQTLHWRSTHTKFLHKRHCKQVNRKRTHVDFILTSKPAALSTLILQSWRQFHAIKLLDDCGLTPEVICRLGYAWSLGPESSQKLKQVARYVVYRASKYCDRGQRTSARLGD